MKKTAELVFIPLPFLSHLKSAVQFAKNLIAHDDRLSITMVLMNSPFHSSDLESYIQTLLLSSSSSFSSSSSSGEEKPRINFIFLPHHYIVKETNISLIMNSFMEHQKPHVINTVTKLISRHDSPRLAGFVFDMICGSMLDVAGELGLPAYVFCPLSAFSVSLLFHFQTLRDQHNLDNNDPVETQLTLPGFVNPIPTRLLSELWMDKAGMNLMVDHFRRFRSEAKGIVLNSFAELESHAVQSLFLDDDMIPSVHPVGPIVNLMCGIDDDDSEKIIKWLNDQPALSVLFLCFGNLGSFGHKQVKEIAKALENSGIRYIWSYRKRSLNQDRDSTDALLEEFANRTAKMGKIIGWAPQVAILSHPATGGFVSHCGWNSLLESLWFGVPVATWPLFGDQQLNAFELVRELGLAVEIKLDYLMEFVSEDDPTVVSAREIEVAIKKVMEHDSDLRKRVKGMGEKSKKALMVGGSSYTSLDRLINNVINNVP